MILSTFLILLLVFTLFELLGDILRNQISPLIVGEYLLNVSPYFLYQITHIAMLLAVLITFGLMQRSNEITAMKATGTSIYRMVDSCFAFGSDGRSRIVFLRPVLFAACQQKAGCATEPDQG